MLPTQPAQQHPPLFDLVTITEVAEDVTGDEVEAVLEDGGATVLAPTLLRLGLGRGAAV